MVLAAARRGGGSMAGMIPRISLALTLSAAYGTPSAAFAPVFCPQLRSSSPIGRRYCGAAPRHSLASRASSRKVGHLTQEGRRVFSTLLDSLSMSGQASQSPPPAAAAAASVAKPQMTIVSWNVNSVNARMESVKKYLEQQQPDVLVLQEIKCVATNFPTEQMQELGYHVLVEGQKSYNGVAILSKFRPELISTALYGGSEDPVEPQARYIEAKIADYHICNLYLPNGNPVNSMKFEYKLRWMDRLKARAEWLLSNEVPFVMLGDYNVCPTDSDCFNRDAMEGDAVVHAESRSKFRSIVNLGLTDALDVANALRAEGVSDAKGKQIKGKGQFTYWGYKGNMLSTNSGLRIDHILLSPQAADVMVDCGVHKDVRMWDRPSDHAPVWVRLHTQIRHRNLGQGGQGM